MSKLTCNLADLETRRLKNLANRSKLAALNRTKARRQTSHRQNLLNYFQRLPTSQLQALKTAHLQALTRK